MAISVGIVTLTAGGRRKANLTSKRAQAPMPAAAFCESAPEFDPQLAGDNRLKVL